MFEQIDNTQRLLIVLESAEIAHQIVEHSLAGVPEGGVSQIMRQADRLGQAFVQAESLCDRSSNLCDLDAVSQAGSVVIVQAGGEDLRFAFEPAKGRAVDNAVAIALEVRAIGVSLFRDDPAPAGLFRYSKMTQSVGHAL